jgi:hypothetical protein
MGDLKKGLSFMEEGFIVWDNLNNGEKEKAQ